MCSATMEEGPRAELESEVLLWASLPYPGTSSRKPLGLPLGLLVLPHIPTWLSTFTPAVCSSVEWTLAYAPGQDIIAGPYCWGMLQLEQVSWVREHCLPSPFLLGASLQQPVHPRSPS